MNRDYGTRRRAAVGKRFRTDGQTKALTEAAGQTMAEHQTVVLSKRDREVFFETLVAPQRPNERLRRAFAEHKRRIVG